MAAGEPLEAVRHRLAAGDEEGAAATLEPIAEALIHSPEAETLGAWLDAFPPELLSGRPGLVLAHASLRFTRGQHEASFAGIERAIDELLVAGEGERACVAFFRLLLSMIAAGAGPPRRLAAIDRFLPRLDPDAPTFREATLMVAVSYGFGCRFAEAEEALGRTMVAARTDDSHALEDYATLVQAFYIDYPQGRLTDALRGLDRVIARLDRDDTADSRLAFGVYARVARGFVLNDVGRHEDALLEAERMRAMAERRSMRAPPLRMYAWQRATAMAGLGQWDHLARELVPPPDAEAPDEVTHYAYRFRVPAALLAAERGDRARLRELVDEARAAMAVHGLSFEHGWMLCELTLAALRAGLSDLAGELADEAHGIATTAGQAWPRARAALLAAIAAGAGDRGDRCLAEAIELTERLGYEELWTRREREWAGRLLARALVAGIAPAATARLLAACGGEVVAECADLLSGADARLRAVVAEAAGDAAGVDAEVLARLALDRDAGVRDAARRSRVRAHARPRPRLRFASLGGFGVWRGDVAVAPSAFGRQRARALLAALLCAGRPVHREELLEWFWPDLPPTRGSRALHVTLHGLRRALGPELARPAESDVIVTAGDAYRAVLSEGDSWDAHELLEAGRTAVQLGDAPARLAALQAARSTYTGPLFPEWPYEEWAQARRAQVEQARMTVLELLAEELTAAGVEQAAIATYRELLDLQPEREGWHRGLMRAYVRCGERALALRQFHACRTVIREELGVEPGPRTRTLYHQILTEQPLEELRA